MPVRATRTLSWLLVVTILAQAELAGPAWFQRPSLFELHGWLGTATLLLGLAVAIAVAAQVLPQRTGEA